MAKDLPYFKFITTEWLTGDIVYESFDMQGMFINICAIYWQRDGILSIDDLRKRLKNDELIDKLTPRFFSVIDGLISVKFLDEQFNERKSVSEQNRKNGEKGGRPKLNIDKEKKPTANRPLTEHKAKLTNKEKEKEKEKEITTTKEKNDDARKIILKNLEIATNSKELPDEINEICKNLISSKFKFSKVTDEILETDLITFYNKDKYLVRREKSSKIKDVFYFTPNGCKFHSLLDLAIYLSTDEVSISQIKTTTRLPDESITDWVLFFIEHIFTEGRGLNYNDAQRNIKYCWKSIPGEVFKSKQEEKTRYNQHQ